MAQKPKTPRTQKNIAIDIETWQALKIEGAKRQKTITEVVRLAWMAYAKANKITDVDKKRPG